MTTTQPDNYPKQKGAIRIAPANPDGAAEVDELRADSGEAEHIAVVGHGGSLRVLICDAIAAPITSMRHFFFENASLSILEEKNTANGMFQRLLLFNDTQHLESLESLEL